MISTRTLQQFRPVEHDPFTIPNIERVVPAIAPQVEIFTSCLMGGEDASRSYNESVSLHLSGRSDQQVLFRACQDVVNRHESLRSSFSSDGLHVFIQRGVDLKIFFQDLSDQSHDEQQRFMDDFKNEEAQTSFDLLNGPLFKVALFKLDEDQQYLTLCAHHIICDGWSLGILLMEVSKFYSAYITGFKIQLGKAPLFSEYAIEQLKFSESEEYHRIERYWIDLYKNSIPVLSVPTDFPRPDLRTYCSRREDFKMEHGMVAAIKKLGAQSGCSFVTTLLSLFKLYLHRLSNQDDIIVGLPAAGQSVTGNYGLVGHCVNLLPLRSTIEKEDSFLQFLQNQQRVVLDAFDHQQFTFSSLLQKLQITRNASTIPLVPIVFNVDLGLDNDVVFEGLQHALISNPRAYETFEIFVNASGSEQAMTLEWSFNTQLFKSSTISKMMRGFEDLIRSIVQNPAIRLQEIKIQNIFEPDQKYLQTNNTDCYYPKERPLQWLFNKKAKEYSGNVAVYSDGHSMTYQELNETANQLADVLLQYGVQTGDIIGLAAERSHKMVIALLAIVKSGAAYVPLDPEYPKDRIEFMLQDSSPKILLISKKYSGIYQSNVKEIIIEDIWPELKHYSKKDAPVEVQGNDLVYLLYTSGSTGQPKGVKVAHHNLHNLLLSIQKSIGIHPNDKMLGLTTLSFDISAVEIYLPLISGASIAIIPGETAKNGNLLLKSIKKIRPTIMQATPATWQMLLEAGWDTDVLLKTICSGGEALALDLANKLNKRCTNLYNLYGPTETTIYSTLKKVSGGDRIITIGQPIDNTQVHILDEGMVPVAQNFIGEIYIAGDGVSKGYFMRSDLTLLRFVDNPFSQVAGDKMYRTGDLGRLLPNGEIQCLGRADHQIKIRGYRIEPGEIEHCLMQQKDIKASVVVAREDLPGDQRLVAYIVPASLLPGELHLLRWKHALKLSLPLYMIPNDFVILENLPLTPNGKIDKKALPAPNIYDRLSKKREAPRNGLETSLVEIWKKLLRVDQVGINDNFFELGGHSLLAMRLISAIRKEMIVEIPLIDIFNSTIQSLAEKIRDQQQPIGFISVDSHNNADISLTYDQEPDLARRFENNVVEWGLNGKAQYVIPIRDTGTKIPFFGIINYNSFRLLGNFMASSQPLYYLPPTQSASVENIASHYVKEMKRVQSSGPYCIGGFCGGGTIAVEIAQQLESQGDEVAALILFECYSQQAELSKKSLQYLKRRIFYYKNRFTSVNQSSESQIDLFKFSLKKSYERFKKPFLNAPPKFVTSPEYKKYVFKPYSRKVVLFQAGNRPLEINDSPLMGWSEYFTGDVEHITVEGGHLGIFREPAIEKLADKLSAVLDKLNSKSE